MACPKVISFLQTEVIINGVMIEGISSLRFGVVEHKRIRWDAQGGLFAQTTGVRSSVMGLMLHGMSPSNKSLKMWQEQERQGNFYEYNGSIKYPSGLKGTLKCGLMIGWNPLLDIYMDPNDLPEHTYLLYFEDIKEDVSAYTAGSSAKAIGTGRPTPVGGGSSVGIFAR